MKAQIVGHMLGTHEANYVLVAAQGRLLRRRSNDRLLFFRVTLLQDHGLINRTVRAGVYKAGCLKLKGHTMKIEGAHLYLKAYA